MACHELDHVPGHLKTCVAPQHAFQSPIVCSTFLHISQSLFSDMKRLLMDIRKKIDISFTIVLKECASHNLHFTFSWSKWSTSCNILRVKWVSYFKAPNRQWFMYAFLQCKSQWANIYLPVHHLFNTQKHQGHILFHTAWTIFFIAGSLRTSKTTFFFIGSK